MRLKLSVNTSEYLVLPVISSGISVVHQWYYQWKSVVKFGVITSCIPVVSIGISVMDIPVVSIAVKLGGITSVSSGITNGIPVVYHWKSVVKYCGITTVIH